MMKPSNFNLLLFVLTLLIFSSCIEDLIDVPDDDDEDINFTAKVDGKSFEAGGFNVAGELSIDESGFYALGIIATESSYTTTGQGRSISITITGDDFDDVDVGDEFFFTGNIIQESVTATYLICEDQSDCAGGTSLSTKGKAYFLITALDKTDQVFSGEFSFTAYDSDTEELYDITNGVFTDVEYIVND